MLTVPAPLPRLVRSAEVTVTSPSESGRATQLTSPPVPWISTSTVSPLWVSGVQVIFQADAMEIVVDVVVDSPAGKPTMARGAVTLPVKASTVAPVAEADRVSPGLHFVVVPSYTPAPRRLVKSSVPRVLPVSVSVMAPALTVSRVVVVLVPVAVAFAEVKQQPLEQATVGLTDVESKLAMAEYTVDPGSWISNT